MIDTPVGPYTVRAIAFQDLVMALEYNVLAPLQRGKLSFLDTPLPFGRHMAMEDQAFVLVLAEEFIEATDDDPDAQPHNVMIRLIASIIKKEPRDSDALHDISCLASRATARVQYCVNAHAQIMRALTLLDQLIEQYASAFDILPATRPHT